MNLCWHSNSPVVSSGYGSQTAQVVSRLKADGHRVAVLGNYGNNAGMTDWRGIPVYPAGREQPAVEWQAQHWFRGEPGVVITLYDVWTFGDRFGDLDVISWTPIDHYPVPPDVLTWCKSHRTIAMSRFGQQALKDVGVESTYIPHALEKVWKPTPSNVRRQMKVSDDAFLVMMNAANVGNAEVDRKAWSVNLRAFADFARDHDDAVLYLNTDPTGGFPIPKFLTEHMQLNPEQMRFTDIGGYRSGFIGQQTVAEMYTAADVLLAASMGEGFGLPVAEAMACGTPAIVTDFSAQPEIVGDTGWKVGYEPFYDKAAGADLALPRASEIRDALEEAYAERGSLDAKRRSIAAMRQAYTEYDADMVFDTYWRPFLASLERKPNRAERRAKR